MSDCRHRSAMWWSFTVMSKARIIKNFLPAIVIAGLGTIAVWTQPPDKSKPSQDPTDKVRNVKPEVKEAYKKWINNDVAYIITNEEKKAFKALATDEERENFIEQFWR